MRTWLCSLSKQASVISSLERGSNCIFPTTFASSSKGSILHSRAAVVKKRNHRVFSLLPAVLSLLIVRPVSIWSLCLLPPLTPKQSAPYARNVVPLVTSRALIMPRTTRTSPTSVLMAKDDTMEEEKEEIATPRKRKAAVAAKDSTSSNAKAKSSAKKKTAATKEEPSPAKKKPRGTTPKASKTNDLPEVDDEDAAVATTGKKKKSSPSKKGKEDHQRITERDPLPKLWDSQLAAKNDGSYTFRIASWNVAGLRAVLKKSPTALADLCTKHDLDMLCLQESKLQESHLDDPKLKIRGCLSEAGYDEYWSCSTVKKGYSGTAVFVKQRGTNKKAAKQTDIGSFFAKKSKAKGDDPIQKSEPANVPAELVTPTDVSFKIGKPIDNEGRTITLEFPFATITNVYVPNSGQVLERLDYRTNEWDKDFLAFQQQKEKDRGVPVIWLGDLNIAHKAYDVWNDGAKHLAKQAGVTEQERVSFQAMLDAGYVDAFRRLHPDAKGHYSYWSQRAGNREPNKGLRLDYFVCSPELFSDDSQAVVRDSYMIPDWLGSDHAPVVLEIELKKKG